MEKINERLYEANIELVDRNKLLEEDFKKLQKNVAKAIELLENDYFEDGSGQNIEEVLETLKGEEYGNNWENSSN